MTQQMYTIREAAKKLNVEAHALRFWEEELELHIERNAQGRRIYSQEDIETFEEIMACKEEGMQLKEIRQKLHRSDIYIPKDLELKNKTAGSHIIMYHPKEVGKQQETVQSLDEQTQKSMRLQELLKQFISESIRENNAEIIQALKEGLIKELDYQFRLQEEREEEREKERTEKEDAHFKQLDENLRSAMEKRGKKRRLFGR